ncbi:methyl-accepting chemotaxis protein [Sagittula salina]|uniref:Methyl-accepting chemotaxis protein n=1 Tax=Sagittula salina TaxID=2820268 RepID=A0A940MMD9_9RHOB|nr:methyl-accepting chemotaxis protein [Sagittula salina]MBP0482004.1 methyl-accepting chemotaxis protein [Sagittula salina]
MKHPTDLEAPELARELGQLTDAATGLGQETVDISGFLQDLDARCQSQLTELAGIGTRAEGLNKASERMLTATQGMAGLSAEVLQRVRQSADFIQETGENSQTLAEWVRSVNADSQSVEEMLMGVKNSNTLISDIAWQVHILAVNAKIEAARAGKAGKGFSIVADNVQDLAQKTSDAAESITKTVTALSDWTAQLHRGAYQTATKAEHVLARNADNDRALTEIQQSVEQLQRKTEGLASDAQQVRSAVTETGQAIEGIAASVTEVTDGVDEASRRCFSLIDTSEAILQNAVALGGSGEDSAMITLVQDLAGQVAMAFEAEIAAGRLTMDALFSESYRPVPRSDPEQVVTPFTDTTDRLLPPIQEPVLGEDARIVFCAAVDRNGYLPTHNAKFSQPQGGDPVWNAANSRNRRIFDDRVGLKAGRNEKPFLLQVYRRDMGGGNFVMMKDLSAPITIRGRHWGGLRLAYKFQ